MNNIVSPKRVSFDIRTLIVEIDALNNYSEDEIRNIWHTEADNRSIQHDIVKTIKSQQSGVQENYEEDEICYKGLEHFQSAEKAISKMKAKTTTINAVLDEQDRLWALEESRNQRFSPDDISNQLAMVYQGHSQQAIENALVLASDDGEQTSMKTC